MATILVVDDRALDRKLLAVLFGSRGHHVLEAADGLEALRLVERQQPDLVISDLLMPNMDGYEFVRQMRMLPQVSDTPVIFYTAICHQQEARALAERCGVREVLIKPSEPDALLARVDALLGLAEPPTTAPVDAASFHREHLEAVSARLEEKVQALEASEQRLATLVQIGQELAVERDAARLLHRVCESPARSRWRTRRSLSC
jgi:CheY-like chemotaxis protein